MCADRANEKKPRSDELAFNLHTNCACISIAADLTFIKYHRVATCIRSERKLHAKFAPKASRNQECTERTAAAQHNAIARFHVLISNACP